MAWNCDSLCEMHLVIPCRRPYSLHCTVGGYLVTTTSNTAYVLSNGHTYITDGSGQVSELSGDLSRTTMDRNWHQQCATGKCGNAGDEGGHLIAASLGGAGDKINIVPQAATLNRKDWRDMERYLDSELKAGKTVNVKIEIGYPPGGGVRPNSFFVTATIDGKIKEFPFKQ